MSIHTPRPLAALRGVVNKPTSYVRGEGVTGLGCWESKGTRRQGAWERWGNLRGKQQMRPRKR
jgi:hypothetical protein